MDKYLVFIVYVYEQKDQAGNFNNSTSVELIADTREEAEARALEIINDPEKPYAYTKTVVEQWKK